MWDFLEQKDVVPPYLCDAVLKDQNIWWTTGKFIETNNNNKKGTVN